MKINEEVKKICEVSEKNFKEDFFSKYRIAIREDDPILLNFKVMPYILTSYIEIFKYQNNKIGDLLSKYENLLFINKALICSLLIISILLIIIAFRS